MHAPARFCPPIKPIRQNIAVTILGALCTALGVAVIAGWVLHISSLVQLRPALAPMQFNTALCFVLAGSALIIIAREKWYRAVQALGGLIAALSGATLAEYIFNFSLGVDQLFFRSYIISQTSNIGRMSPVSALCFVFIGIALLIIGWHRTLRGLPLTVGTLASIVISINVVALLGYAFGLPGTYGWGQLTRIAMHTSAGFGFAGAALFIIAWNQALRAGERTPRWLPIPLALGIFAGSLILSFALDSKQNADAAQAVKAAAEGTSDQLAVRMDARMHALLRMAKRWEFADAPSRAEWEDDAANYVHDFPDMQSIEWIDNAHLVRWVVPLAGNQEKINHNLIVEPRRAAAVALAEHDGKPVITRAVSLFRGGIGFIIYVPVVVHGKLEGLIAAVFDAQACLARYFPPTVAEGEAIRISDGGQSIFERDSGTPAPRLSWWVHQEVKLHGANWEVEMWPTPALARRLASPLPQVLLCAGVFGALLLGTVCLLAQRASRHAIETARANVALQAALDQVKTLEGLLPICCGCKRVRDDTGYWNKIDSYLCKHTRASLSHGYCPECAAKAFTEMGVEVPEQVLEQLAAKNFEE